MSLLGKNFCGGCLYFGVNEEPNAEGKKPCLSAPGYFFKAGFDAFNCGGFTPIPEEQKTTKTCGECDNLTDKERPDQSGMLWCKKEKFGGWWHHKHYVACDGGFKEKKDNIGRCRRHAPTMNGWPVMFDTDDCSGPWVQKPMEGNLTAIPYVDKGDDIIWTIQLSKKVIKRLEDNNVFHCSICLIGDTEQHRAEYCYDQHKKKTEPTKKGETMNLADEFIILERRLQTIEANQLKMAGQIGTALDTIVLIRDRELKIMETPKEACKCKETTDDEFCKAVRKKIDELFNPNFEINLKYKRPIDKEIAHNKKLREANKTPTIADKMCIDNPASDKEVNKFDIPKSIDKATINAIGSTHCYLCQMADNGKDIRSLKTIQVYRDVQHNIDTEIPLSDRAFKKIKEALAKEGPKMQGSE